MLEDDAFTLLMEGRKRISPGIAQRLSDLIGRSTSFWLERDRRYCIDAERMQGEVERWIATIPVADMVKFGWIAKPQSRHSRAATCLQYFGVRTVEEWEDVWGKDGSGGAAFRTSPTYRANAGAVSAWLRLGERCAEAVPFVPWSPERLKAALPALRQLTRLHAPERFMPRLLSLCQEAGVTVCVARAPTGCRASGATRFLPNGRVLVMLSFRYLSDDHFWFTFFHEVGHLLLHAGQDFIEGEGTPESEMEAQANEFSANVLIPPEFHSRFRVAARSYDDAIRCARDIGVSPGVLVGQLQHREILPKERMNRLKRRFSWEA